MKTERPPFREPRRRLTLDQRAARTARMKNKKLIASAPLLADELRPGGQLEGWLATDAGERTRIEIIAEGWKEAMVSMRDLNETHSDKALALRDLVAARVSADELARLDERQMNYPNSPAYHCEFWYSRLREIDQPEAARRCENQHMHAMYAKYDDRCGRCHTPLTRPEQPRQLMIGEHA